MFQSIEFVPFTARDSRTLWEIRNHQAVRPFMSRPAPIDYASHEDWVRRHLLRNRTVDVHFIRFNGSVRGFVLLRDYTARGAEFGVMMDPRAPRGLGVVCTALVLDRLFQTTDIVEVRAKIVRHNRNSIGSTLGIGGREVDATDARHRYFVFAKDRFRLARRATRLVEKYRSRCRFLGPFMTTDGMTGPR